jgi:glyoxylase-like metal-dependent hydrolase (beta-lactamase superfamily II)
MTISLTKMGAGLDRLDIGGVTVVRVPDMDAITWSPEAMFERPEAELATLVREAPGRSVDRATNRLRLSFNSYLLLMPSAVVLVDCGAGDDKERPDRPPWHRRRSDFLDRLALAGARPDDVSLVVNTHLHADHVGWNTQLVDGRWRPTFPNARYVVGREELAYWLSRDAAASADTPILHGAFADSVAPLLELGLLEGVDLPATLLPGLTLEHAPGHTPGMAVVRCATSAGDVLIAADAIHHPLQLAHPALNTRFCTDGITAAATRAALLDRCAAEGTVLAPYHFPAPGFGRIVRIGAGFGFAPLHG